MCISFKWWHEFCGHDTVSDPLPCVNQGPGHTNVYVVHSFSFCRSCGDTIGEHGYLEQEDNQTPHSIAELLGAPFHRPLFYNQLFGVPQAMLEKLADHLNHIDVYSEEVLADPIRLNDRIIQNINYRRSWDDEMFLCHNKFSYGDHCRVVDAYRRMGVLIFYMTQTPSQVEQKYLPMGITRNRAVLLLTQLENALAWNKSLWEAEENTPGGEIRSFFSGKVDEFPSNDDEDFSDDEGEDITDLTYREPTRKLLEATILESVAIADLEEDSTECAICYDQLGTQYPDGKLEYPVKLACPGGHIFGYNCIMDHFLARRFRCPMCNHDLKQYVGDRAYEGVKNAHYPTPPWLVSLIDINNLEDYQFLDQVYERDGNLDSLF